jgi:extradiol dioxygenase family protein
MFRRVTRSAVSAVRRRTGAEAVVALAALLVFGSPARAQVAAPNATGMSMGHLHYHVENVEAQKRFWIALGGQPIRVGSIEAMKFPDILIFLTEADTSGTSEGSVLDHIGFKVPHIEPVLEKLREAGATVIDSDYKNVRNVLTPDGDRIELFAELTENAYFHLDEGQVDEVAERHNRKMTVPITTHHVHIYNPPGGDGFSCDSDSDLSCQAQAWYVTIFGGTPGTRWDYKAVDIPGMNFNFLDSEETLAPTKGRTLDHIGFEVEGLEAFCKRLEADGIKFDVPYSEGSNGFASAFLTDPYGTYIELTEGLNGF